jgi:hypothetical protein
MNAEAADLSIAPAVESPASSDSFDRTYWVDHCEGYRVESEHGRLGVVEEVWKDRGETTIAVRAGVLGRHLLAY